MAESIEKQTDLKEKGLGLLLESMQVQVSQYARQIKSQVDGFAKIGIALSAEQNLGKLLELIVDEARSFTGADAGTLYILEGDFLHFKIFQNELFKVNIEDKNAEGKNLPPVPLDKSNVSAFCAITGEVVNIADVYDDKEFNFTGPRNYDKMTGYRSKSMLVVPMKNRGGQIIGVLQLLNAKDAKTGDVIPFGVEFVAVARSLASLAAVAVTTHKAG